MTVAGSSPDLTLYLVADWDYCAAGGIDSLAMMEAALRGGAGIVQLRDKRGDRAAFRDWALAARDRLAGRVPLILNDDVALAAELGLGAHIGQDDGPAEAARALLAPGALLGISVSTPDEAALAEGVADHLGVGPAFPTGTKRDARAAIGPEGVARVVAATRIPVVAIGGINLDTAAQLTPTRAAGIAVVSAICGAADPEAAARSLKDKFKNGR